MARLLNLGTLTNGFILSTAGDTGFDFETKVQTRASDPV
jgi:hypothetical protein